MSYTSSDPENLHRDPEASSSDTAPKTKKKPWSKLKSSFKSIKGKMSAKPRFTEATESSEQKRARKNKKFKSEEGREESPSKGSKGLMKKLSVESLAAPFVGMQPSTIDPAKSYAKAVNNAGGSTSESNLSASASDPDTPKKTSTPDSGRASQTTDVEEAVVGSLVAKTEQFAQSLLPPQAAKEKLKDVSAEFVKAEGRSPAQRRRPSKETEGELKGSPDVKKEVKADLKQDASKTVEQVEVGRKKGASVDFIKSEASVEAKAKTDDKTVKKQKSEEKLGKDTTQGKISEPQKPPAKDNQSKPQNPPKVEDKSTKEQKMTKLDDKPVVDAKEASKRLPDSKEQKQQSNDTNKDKVQEKKEVPKTNNSENSKKVQESKDVKEGSKTQNVDKENKQLTKVDAVSDKKDDSKSTPLRVKVKVLPENGKKNDEIKEAKEENKSEDKVEESKTTLKAKENTEGGKDSSSDPSDRLMSVERKGVGLTVEEKLEAFLSAETWPSSLREEVALSTSGKASQQGGGGDKRECLYKILVIGELGTGKTSIIKRYVHQFFSQHYRATIGVDFALKVLNWDPNTIIRLQLWDIAGQERFGNMTRVYYKEAVGAFIVFDVTRSATFDAVLKWKQDLDSKVQLADGAPIPCVLLANKCDQQKEGLVNTPSKMDDYCKENNFSAWFETSAKENINIDDAAKSLVTQILQNDKMSQNGRDSARDGSKFPLDGKQEEDGRGGCAC